MDKIQEEFEEEYSLKPCPFCGDQLGHSQECYIYLLLKYERNDGNYTVKGLKEQAKAWNTRSRNPEIEKLKNDCKNLIDINNNQNDIMKSRDKEIKKLREALGKGSVELCLALRHIYKGKWCAADERVKQARYYLEKALKDPS